MLVGRGTTADVYKLSNDWASKIYNDQSCFITEVAIMKKMNHENIIALKSFRIRNNMFYIIMPYIKYNLHNYISSFSDISLRDKKLICLKILSGINYLHSQNIIHRDLKSLNILISDDFSTSSDSPNIKIIDFGMSLFVSDINKMIPYEEDITTICYRAPEFLTKSNYTKAIDIWAFGCIIYHVYAEELLFSDTDEISLKDSIKIFSNNTDIYKNLISDIEMGDLMIECLQIDPSKRYQNIIEKNLVEKNVIEVQLSGQDIQILYRYSYEKICRSNDDIFYLSMYIYHLYIHSEKNGEKEHILYTCFIIAGSFITNYYFENLYPDVYISIILATQCDFLVHYPQISIENNFIADQLYKFIYYK
jgi:serine/threonine protein kinase